VSWVTRLETGTVLFAAFPEMRVNSSRLEVSDFEQLVPEFVPERFEFVESFGHVASYLTYIIQSDIQPKKKKHQNVPTFMSHAQL